MDIDKRISELKKKHSKEYRNLVFEYARELFGLHLENFPKMKFINEEEESNRGIGEDI